MGFRSNTPVVGPGFYDREVEVDRLVQAARRLPKGGPVWTAVLGVRKVGKTSLLAEVARRLDGSEPRLALIDVFEDLPASLRFFRRYALRVAETLLGVSLEVHARKPSAYRAALLAAPRFRDLAGPLQRNLLELPELSEPQVLRVGLELPERLAEAVDSWLVVAIDGFQELASIRAGRHADPIPLMRSIWQRHRRVAYVPSSRCGCDSGNPAGRWFR